MEAKEYVRSFIDRGRVAQSAFEDFSQEEVDAAVRAIGKANFDHAEELARMAVEETGMGVYEDKIVKNTGKAMAVWERLKGVKSRGVIRYLEDKGLVEIAKPIGVIGSVTPTTNATTTPMQNSMIALKGGNAVIVCPHPRAKNAGARCVELMREALTSVGAPADLIQIIPEPTVEISGLVMAMCDTCISTGGPAMVKAAFSSGRPAFGVGPGNVQSLVDSDANIEEVVPKLIKSRTYDNGILCTCEQSVICNKSLYDTMIEEMKKNNVFYIESKKDVDAMRNTMFPTGSINKNIVGASAFKIAERAGIEVPKDTKMLLVKLEKTGKDEYLSKEKLCPVMTAYKYESWEDAVKIARSNLLNEGAGHSCVLHSNTKEHIEYAAEKLPVSRFSVNQIGSSSLGGSFKNGLDPTSTLGCGSWGNNSLSANLWWNHLVNISRIAYEIQDAMVPTPEEVWNG